MNAGSELDRLIGEKVMGLHAVQVRKLDGWYQLRDSEDRIFYRGFSTPESAWTGCPSYSTNIGWAWQVVEKIEERVSAEAKHFELAREAEGWMAGTYYAWTDNIHQSDYGATAPEAICRLALAVFGVEVPA